MASLTITKATASPMGNGIWIEGETESMRFEAKVYKTDGPNDMHLGKRSGIAKLWIQQKSTGQTVFNYDRGMDVEPTTADAARLVRGLTSILPDVAPRKGFFSSYFRSFNGKMRVA